MACVSRTCLLLVLAVACSGGCQDRAAAVAIHEVRYAAQPPLEISFLPAEGLRAKQGEVLCSVPAGRDEMYDPQTGVFHIHFSAGNLKRSALEVTKAKGPFARPVVFRFTGVPTGYGCLGHPLTLAVDDKSYGIDASCDSQYYWAEHVDQALVRSKREKDAVIVEFTERGQALLKPGARISLEVDYGW
jgi:hypothetical protein